MLTIGIVGGMGPAATVDFFGRLIASTRAATDQDHPQCLIYSASQVPDRTAHLLHGTESPTKALLEAASLLVDAGAHLIAIPCNSAHAYLEEIRKVVSIPVLDMIGLAVEAIQAGWPTVKRVGLLAADGTRQLGLYDRPLRAVALEPLYPTAESQVDVMLAIRAIKGGLDGAERPLQRASIELMERGAEIILLGCTELPLGFDVAACPLPVVDSADCLVDECLRAAGALRIARPWTT